MLEAGNVARCMECAEEKANGGCICVVRLAPEDLGHGLIGPTEVPVRVLWASDVLGLGVCHPKRRWLTLLPTAEAVLYLL